MCKYCKFFPDEINASQEILNDYQYKSRLSFNQFPLTYIGNNPVTRNDGIAIPTSAHPKPSIWSRIKYFFKRPKFSKENLELYEAPQIDQ